VKVVGLVLVLVVQAAIQAEVVVVLVVEVRLEQFAKEHNYFHSNNIQSHNPLRDLIRRARYKKA
jgi:hypothetical protein